MLPSRPAGAPVSGGWPGFPTGSIVAAAAGGAPVVGRLADVKPDDPVGIALPLLDRRVLGNAVGSPVEVTAVDAVPTQSMTLLVSDDGQKQTARRFETALRTTLAGQPVTPGRQ